MVERESHWRNWDYQNNVVRDVSSRMDSTGLFDFSILGVKPRYFGPIENYVLDRADFRYRDDVRHRGQDITIAGSITALSNNDLARNVGVGDVTTFWEPAQSDSDPVGLRNWQVLVDLGRVVLADSISVVFPPIESGGRIAVPVVPAGADALADLTAEQQFGIHTFSRRFEHATDCTLPSRGDR